MEYPYNEKFMRRAIELGRIGSMEKKTGGAFGAVIVKDNQIIAEGYNQVLAHNDPTWHAEMHAIREACAKEGSPHLTNCILYTSAECCPMCLSAAYWARIDHIYFAARVEDAEKYGEFIDVDIFTEVRKKPLDRTIRSVEKMRDEAVEVWKAFTQMPDRAKY